MAFINFDSNNQLIADFNQTSVIGIGSAPYYVQSSTGGISGGAVTGYSGSDYFATAIYNQQAFNFSIPGSTIYQSIDIFYNGNTQPLAPGANGVRSFRLGLLDSASSAFEAYGDASVYIEGIYSLTDKKMLLAGVSSTQRESTGLGLSEIAITANYWVRVEAKFTNQGSGQVDLAGSFFDLGPNGKSAPVLLSSWDWTYQNQPIAASNSLYAGFSVLADGGVSKADNYGVGIAPFEVPPALGPTPGAGLFNLVVLIALGVAAKARREWRMRWAVGNVTK